jgi:hypothetical protein
VPILALHLFGLVLECPAASHIFEMRNRFQMIRMHTRGLPTDMVQFQPFRDWTD